MPLCPRFHVTVGESTITAPIMESELSVHLTESPTTLGGSTKQMLCCIHTPVSILCAQCLAQSWLNARRKEGRRAGRQVGGKGVGREEEMDSRSSGRANTLISGVVQSHSMHFCSGLPVTLNQIQWPVIPNTGRDGGASDFSNSSFREFSHYSNE